MKPCDPADSATSKKGNRVEAVIKHNDNHNKGQRIKQTHGCMHQVTRMELPGVQCHGSPAAALCVSISSHLATKHAM
jgi:hypothetical protein